MTNITITHINLTHRRWNHLERIARAERLADALAANGVDMQRELGAFEDPDLERCLNTLAARAERVEAWLDGARSVFVSEL